MCASLNLFLYHCGTRYFHLLSSFEEPLGTMEVAKLHAKSDRIPEHVFEVCRAGRYRTVVHD